ncbi:MAG: Nif3-like dinuclear metal center hexameric protein [Methylophilaceae bacterium]
MKLSVLLDYTSQLLEPARFSDYCPNGLQVQGRAEVKVLVSGVSASLAFLEQAAEAGADAVLVHHGWFWKNEDARVVGTKHTRLKFLLERDISLIAYHLPLDAHVELGNNAQLAKKLGFELQGWSGQQNILAHGRLPQALTLKALSEHVQNVLKRAPFVVGEADKIIQTIAWCTGAAQDYLAQALELGVDAFLTGEVSEQTVHLARESGVAFIAAGHHATERYGVQALGQHLADNFGLKHTFIDVDNPI